MKILPIVVFLMLSLAGCAIFQDDPIPTIGEPYSQVDAVMGEIPSVQTITDATGETDIYNYDRTVFGGCDHTVVWVNSQGLVTNVATYFVGVSLEDPDAQGNC